MTDRTSPPASSSPNRRQFLGTAGSALGATWLVGAMPLLQACGEAAREAAETGAPLRFLTPDQHTGLEALTARIIPTDDTPGAREARVARFMDQAFAEGLLPGLDQGTLGALGMADGLAAERGGTDFAALGEEAQDEILDVMSGDPASPYGALFVATMMGMFANPEYGGNADELGWRLLGFQRASSFSPPFGHYDRLYREGGLG